jgi:glutamate formiminotransferase/formiminotetrahydrofolate cyclodeaminase
VGARNFLIAVNFNLDTTSTDIANEIAYEVREKGHPHRKGIPGTLKGCKAIGWFIDEYGIAQVSMNITDINTTPLHVAYNEVCRAAQNHEVHVRGTEIIGLVPERCLIEAGRYFLEEKNESTDMPTDEIIATAIKNMGLDDLKPFEPQEKVIEYLI